MTSQRFDGRNNSHLQHNNKLTSVRLARFYAGTSPITKSISRFEKLIDQENPEVCPSFQMGNQRAHNQAVKRRPDLFDVRMNQEKKGTESITW